jgi:hypothetical protein
MNTILHQNNQQLIQLAIDILKEKQPDIPIHTDDYSIKVWRGANGASVDFTRIIRYVPLDKASTHLFYDIIVNLVNQSIIPFDDTFKYGEFYIPTQQDVEAMAFIKKHFGVFSSQFENTILEEAEEYKISSTNENSFGYYTLNKITGEQGPPLQGSYLQMPNPNLGNEDIFND